MSVNDLLSKSLKKDNIRQATILASAARTASNSSSDFTNKHTIGAHLILDITVAPGIETLTIAVEGKDPTSGKYYSVLTSAALTATGTTILKVYPGITATANLAVSDILPSTFRVTATHSAASSWTYSIGVVYS